MHNEQQETKILTKEGLNSLLNYMIEANSMLWKRSA